MRRRKYLFMISAMLAYFSCHEANAKELLSTSDISPPVPEANCSLIKRKTRLTKIYPELKTHILFTLFSVKKYKIIGIITINVIEFSLDIDEIKNTNKDKKYK